MTSKKDTNSKERQVLIIEDNEDIVDLLEIHLKDRHCNLTKAYNGLEGFQLAQKGNYDLIVLDIMLPEMGGTEVCQKLRRENNFTPILMISAKAEKYDKVLGLEFGADAYMTKPFRISEFIKQIDALFCKPSLDSPQTNRLKKEMLEVGDLKLNAQNKEVFIRNQKLDLSCKEFDILCLLASTPGKNYSRMDILKMVWGHEIKGYEHTVNTHINRLRSKLEWNLQSPNYILTSLGLGYRFNEKLLT